MPNNDQTLDLEKLKTDPKMWMRLATPLDGSNVLKHVFSGAFQTVKFYPYFKKATAKRPIPQSHNHR